ncbi:hypothetical protein FHX74_001102 [Friedmanniella endophytica]|uniref:Uncharacterized protein n=1 Tax=Microlunatus kandeliicorticis TaxID=1759536 RepID=A0A7W3P553_9ACTN|nr:hypothetical protein [Microlunatus kandeliicorticis]
MIMSPMIMSPMIMSPTITAVVMMPESIMLDPGKDRA